MREFVRPNVVVSRCLEFDHCRYNGDMISILTVTNLMEYVDFLPVCPEVESGFGIPRNPARIILENGRQRLVQSASGRHVTGVMEAFCTDFPNSTGDIEGFILKYRSPSCGIFDMIQKYRDGKISLSPAINSIRAWAVRFEGQCLMSQTFFKPFPEDLLEVDCVDSQLKENLWK